MSKEQKRYRQINIMESFQMGKKPKIKTDAPDMKTNLRNLMAAAAEKRLESKELQSKMEKLNRNNLDYSWSHAGTSACPDTLSEKLQISESEDSCVAESTDIFESSADLFGSSTELFPDYSPVIEQCSSQESIGSTIVNSESSSTHSAELLVEDFDNEVDSIPEDESDIMGDQIQLSYLNRMPDCSISLPQLEPLENHSIMFSPHIRSGYAPRPFPSSYRDKWDPDHVRMPCSPQNKYPVDENGHKEIRSRWDLICHSLSRTIESSKDLEDAIMLYNSQYIGKWNFSALHLFFNRCLTGDEHQHFFEEILPGMINMTLNLPNICTQPVPLLKKGKDHFVTMTQKQIACLLLNAFFCTFPRRNYISRSYKIKWNSEYYSYPDINFNRIFANPRKSRVPANMEKLKCLFHYFRRIVSKEPTGTVTFHRQVIRELPRWQKSTRGIRTAIIKSEGLIEADGHGMLEVDFANKFVGGGVLGQGCVQEEIRFVICPELIVSRLFVECLGPNEVLIITGVEQYSKYSGYGDSFKWEGNFQDQTARDTWGRRYTEIVAMDATHFRNPAEQFKLALIERELNKAFCGFYKDALPHNLPAIATGNWGCGVYNGDPHLKFLIQLMAASQSNRDIVYFTFGNRNLRSNLKKIYNFLAEKNLAVGDLWRILISYSDRVKWSKNGFLPKMHEFLLSLFSNEESDTEYVQDKVKSDLTDSDKIAIERLIEDVNDDCSTEIEDNYLINDPG